MPLIFEVIKRPTPAAFKSAEHVFYAPAPATYDIIGRSVLSSTLIDPEKATHGRVKATIGYHRLNEGQSKTML
jgi:hypothetical protein